MSVLQTELQRIHLARRSVDAAARVAEGVATTVSQARGYHDEYKLKCRADAAALRRAAAILQEAEDELVAVK